MVKNYTSRTRKHLTVVVYDIADDKRRAKIVKLLQPLGDRINYSVFECMLTRRQRQELQAALQAIINPAEDQVALYNICVDCYAKTVYLPNHRPEPRIVVVT